MTAPIIKLDTPIDVMYLMHKALRAEAEHVVQLVDRLGVDASLQSVQQAFQRWSTALGRHAEAEDQHMTSLLDAPSARDNEAVHQKLADLIVDLQTYLHAAGQSTVTARTQRHLLGRVVTLQIAQDDHLEEEEEFVLPVIRQRLSTTQQVEIARHLLWEPWARDEHWLLDWVAQYVTALEQQWLGSIVCPLQVGKASSHKAGATGNGVHNSREHSDPHV
jgi:hemerythrin-like domain-containing protein